MHTKQSSSEGAACPGGELIKHLRLDVRADLSVGKLIGVVIVVIIGLLLLPIVQDSVTDAKNSTDSTGDTLLDMVPIFYVLGVVLACVLWVVAETRGMGK